MADAPQPYERPLSPHLQIYRLPMTALMSITHRITGVGLSAGLVLVAAFFVSAAMGEKEFNAVREIMGTWWGIGVLFAWSVALFYHTCNGVRHLVWDTVHCLEEKQAVLAGWVVLLFTAILTALAWAIPALTY